GKPVTRRANWCRFIEEGHCFIRWDGDVSPCMGLLHTADTFLGEHKRRIHHHSFGNVYEQSLGEIWNSKAYQDFRRRVHEFRYAPCLFCGGCLWGQGFAVCP
ncbi:MAG: SPASM domain-containing protein, partial [Oscillospiraceae bacterium]|nr:SPASM domain-containing protein [Oscillospiraceae bacterium]